METRHTFRETDRFIVETDLGQRFTVIASNRFTQVYEVSAAAWSEFSPSGSFWNTDSGIKVMPGESEGAYIILSTPQTACRRL